jgi:hypothetical protein
MTRTNATLATIAVCLSIPVAFVIFAIVIIQPLTWRIIGWSLLALLLAVGLGLLGRGIYELWRFFRNEEWNEATSDSGESK